MTYELTGRQSDGKAPGGSPGKRTARDGKP